MHLRVLTWNLRRATRNSEIWEIIRKISPDVMILQEVGSVPHDLFSEYSWLSKIARSKGGGEQSFSTVILSRYSSIKGYLLSSSIDWVRRELSYFKGNILAGEISINNYKPVRIISVYSPAWPVPDQRTEGIDKSSIKLTQNNQLFCTELVWAALKEEDIGDSANWIVAGDFNSSITFDFMWGKKPRGNQEIIDRMNSMGLKECLFTYNGQLTPTFRNAKDGKIIHQMDHVYVTQTLVQSLNRCYVATDLEIFEKNLSDHLPIITEFEM